MWLKRSEFTNLIKAYERERASNEILGAQKREFEKHLEDNSKEIGSLRYERDILKERIAKLEAANLSLQNSLAEVRMQLNFQKEIAQGDMGGMDMMAEDENEVKRLVSDIKQYGRDHVIAREAANERV
jgi:chromosome segregation ATPase